MYYHENIFNKRRQKQEFPASNVSSFLEHAFHSTYDLRKTIEAALQNNNNKNAETRHNNDKENLNNNEISSSHNQKFPLSTIKILLRRSSTKKKKKKYSFLPQHPKRKQNSSYTRSRRITAGEREGAQAAHIFYQKNPGRKKKKKTKQKDKKPKKQNKPQKTKRKTKSREMFYSPVKCKGECGGDGYLEAKATIFAWRRDRYRDDEAKKLCSNTSSAREKEELSDGDGELGFGRFMVASDGTACRNRSTGTVSASYDIFMVVSAYLSVYSPLMNGAQLRGR
jgi:hypothetical protein